MELLLKVKEWTRSLKSDGCACMYTRVALAWALLQREVERGVPKSGETPPSSAQLCLFVVTSSPPCSFLCPKLPAGPEPALPSERTN